MDAAKTLVGFIRDLLGAYSLTMDLLEKALQPLEGIQDEDCYLDQRVNLEIEWRVVVELREIIARVRTLKTAVDDFTQERLF